MAENLKFQRGKVQSGNVPMYSGEQCTNHFLLESNVTVHLDITLQQAGSTSIALIMTLCLPVPTAANDTLLHQ